MSKIETSLWKEFKMVDLGFECFHGTRLTKANRIEGSTPFLTAGKENQGLSCFILSELPTYKDSITIDMFGNCFFHKGSYSGDDNIYFFVNHNLTDNTKQFLTCCISSTINGKYSYTKQFRQNDANNVRIKLPVDIYGNPDWDYMEQYMKNIEATVNKKLTCLENAKNISFNPITTTDWKEFKVGDLFNGLLGKNYKPDNEPTSSSFPFITSTIFNNGFNGYVVPESENHIVRAPALTVGSRGRGDGITFYQENDFIPSNNVTALILKNGKILSKYQGLFIAAILTKSHDTHDYTNIMSMSETLNYVLKLPAKLTSDDKYEPDWDFMEQYMKNIETIAKNKISMLESL